MLRRPPADSIPATSGVYLFRDPAGAVLYVGKAKSVRKRLASYFARDLSPRTRAMMRHADSVEWIVTATEVDAIMLEFSLIREHQPRFNIRFRDDKSFPYLAITRNQEWPRISVMRGKRRKGVQYFGPYAHVNAIKQTRDLLLRTFPIRSCTDGKYRSHESLGRPCLLFHIERCSGPCVGDVTRETYLGYVDGMAAFLNGDSVEIVTALSSDMQDAADVQDYERAARIRDRLAAIDKALARQELVTQSPNSFDLIAFEADDLEVVLVVLNVKRGRVTGRKTIVIDRVEELTTGQLVGVMLGQLYGEESPPSEVLVQTLPEDLELWENWLGVRRSSRVSLWTPKRGAKRRLMEMARTNAKEEFARHRLKRASDFGTRAKDLRSLQLQLQLESVPLRIEAYDISTTQGRDTVGSMVVFEDGLPKKSDYRRFKVKTVTGQDDFAAIEEVLRRRFSAYLAECEKPIKDRGKFAYPPSLVLVDGGEGQLGRAVKVLADLRIEIPVVGLAKKLEEVHRPGALHPLTIPRGEPALYLLQRVRDEAHRFAVAYHRTVRGRRMVDSILDGVRGVGPIRKRALLRRFGSLKRMRDADIDQLEQMLPAQVAMDLYETLHA